ncbi:hypothetical protein GQ53DRAFT_752696 [Thozetella sp. PMI_491]|nr:hypothetical protein GQ53DRAFT_752696 [Thozetella sp. PMI_491]
MLEPPRRGRRSSSRGPAERWSSYSQVRFCRVWGTPLGISAIAFFFFLTFPHARTRATRQAARAGREVNHGMATALIVDADSSAHGEDGESSACGTGRNRTFERVLERKGVKRTKSRQTNRWVGERIVELL